MSHHNLPNPTCYIMFNTFMSKQNGCHFADDIFKFIFYTKIVLFYQKKFHWNLLTRVQLGSDNNNKPLSEPIMALFTDADMHW